VVNPPSSPTDGLNIEVGQCGPRHEGHTMVDGGVGDLGRLGTSGPIAMERASKRRWRVRWSVGGKTDMIDRWRNMFSNHTRTFDNSVA
jgi:hypothetical protein